jgi:ubiquinone/menaquinone biosynthesis C-methylase UbiE
MDRFRSPLNLDVGAYQESLETTMTHANVDSAFAGSIPQFYERYLVPLIFEPYAVDLASRAARRKPSRVLEVAAGTGVVTRRLATVLAPGVSIVATDLNPLT